MIYINLTIFLLILAGFFASVKSIKIWETMVDKKKDKLYFLYPIADWILIKTRLEKVLKRKTKLLDSLRALHVTAKTDIIQRLFWISKVSLVLFILFLCNILSLFFQLQTSNKQGFDGTYIARPDFGEGSKDIELQVSMDPITDGEKSNEKENREGYKKNITVEVEEREYSKEELKKAFDNAKAYLDREILGENKSADYITSSLNLCNSIPGTKITVRWDTADINLVNREGMVHNEAISSDGVITSITAILSYKEITMDYIIPIRIMPKLYSEEERLTKVLKDKLDQVENESKKDNKIRLPDQINDYRLNWTLKKPSTGITLLIFGVGMAILVWVYQDKELEEKMKKRNAQLLMDYPEIINKFTLLVNAGMTVKQTWNKITEDYVKKKERYHIGIRYAYEEMLVTGNELKLGIAEDMAYEQFGRRTGLLPYMKFCSLVAQNLKKGSRGLSELLLREAIDSFEDRKETAKRLGEEAGTKLLAPMMIMLMIVFIVILIPAFMSFRI